MFFFVVYIVCDWLNFSILQGVVRTSCSDRRCVIQGVHELYDSHVTTPWQPEETPTNIIVFIGNMIFYGGFFSVQLLSVLHGQSVFSPPPQRPMTSDFEEFSIPD